MKRGEFLKTAWLAATAVGGSRLFAAERKAAAAARPNVLFLFPDQMRADVCGTYGDPALQNINTPHLDQLPTLCGLVGITAPKDLDGVDLSGELTGRGKASSREVLLANYQAREADFVVSPKNWPWSGKAVCKRYLLDHDRDLTLVGESVLDEDNPTVNFCMPAPGVSRITLTPDGEDRGG